MTKIEIGKKAKGIILRDHKVIINTTREIYPLVVEKADGDYIYDVDGNKYIDFSTFISVYNLGYNIKEIKEAIKNQLDLLMHGAFTDFYSELPVRFAERLLELMPNGFGKIFFSNSGTEANEAAIKIAKYFSRRLYIMGFYNSFHGRTRGSLAVTSSKNVQRAHFGPFPDVIHVPYPYCYRCPFKQSYPECGFACIEYIKEYPLKREVSPEEVAAFIVEPIQGEGGYIVPPKDYFKELKRILDDYGILLIDDEVQAGYMRTGKFLALDNFDVTADIYTMAKAIGGGLPLGATIIKRDLGDLPEGAHASTFGGNLLSIAAADAALKYLIDNKREIERGIKQRSSIIMKRLEELKERYEIVGDVRGIGLMIGVEFVKSKKTKEPNVKARDAVLEEAFYNGLVMLPAGESTIRIIPSFNISIDTLNQGLDILEEAVKFADSNYRSDKKA
ncbi:MAG: aspartate aminotransferase family protein [Candidatus Micrarchaeota archaeon]|nr:MAG: aspartate aminotransferase family protein [Candidatus Micrarchaeota archaeon]